MEAEYLYLEFVVGWDGDKRPPSRHGASHCPCDGTNRYLLKANTVSRMEVISLFGIGFFLFAVDLQPTQFDWVSLCFVKVWFIDFSVGKS